MNDCDNTSVGVLVVKGGSLLLIERKRPPYGFAPPAGHLDKRLSYEDAAKEELREEVGLTTTKLVTVFEGRLENPCRRNGGSWHFWRVYRAGDLTGELVPSVEEVKSIVWCDILQFQELRSKTMQYTSGVISDDSWRLSPGIEPVWIEIIDQISWKKLTDDPKPDEIDNQFKSLEYGFKYFEYHARQRQGVFRFFIIIVGVVITGLISTFSKNTSETISHYRWAFGISISVFSLLFWQLDRRSHSIICSAEKHMKFVEGLIAANLEEPTARITYEADKCKDNSNITRYVNSFSKVYSVIFFALTIVGLIIFVSSILCK